MFDNLPLISPNSGCFNLWTAHSLSITFTSIKTPLFKNLQPQQNLVHDAHYKEHHVVLTVDLELSHLSAIEKAS